MVIFRSVGFVITRCRNIYYVPVVGKIMLRCPQPFRDCRPGACNCDGVYDIAKYQGRDAMQARNEYINKLNGRRFSVIMSISRILASWSDRLENKYFP